MSKQVKNPLRLRKKHGDGTAPNVSAADGQRLMNAQSLRGAFMAGLITIIIFSVFWIALTELFDRVFPWLTVLLGYLLGFAVRIAGKGVDWRFPLLAALLAIVGAVTANVMLAAVTTAESLGVGTLSLLQSVTSMTWPVFFDEVWTVADSFFAIVAASLAAFFANRRLTRTQFHGLRLWRTEINNK